ncbi:MAG: tail fiber domain-containing protein [Pseudomonadota bacterium]
MGSSGGSQKSTTTSTPWSGVQPYLLDYLKRGQQTTNSPFSFYNGDTVAGFAPEQEAGFNLGTQRALAGSPTLGAANRNITDTLKGNYLSPDSNPYLAQTANRAMDDVQTRVNSQFSGNNYGSSANQELLTRNLGDVANSIYGQNYTNERNNQLQAAGMSTGLASADYQDADYLQGIGAQRQGLANQYLGNAATTYDKAASFPYEQLDRYGNVVSQGTGQGGTSTTKGPSQGGSTLGTVAGLALTAASLFSDARLKTNIKKVGTHPLGIGIYEYDKFGERERGVMAQEAEKVKPEAVTTHASGFKQVNYGLLN